MLRLRQACMFVPPICKRGQIQVPLQQPQPVRFTALTTSSLFRLNSLATSFATCYGPRCAPVCASPSVGFEVPASWMNAKGASMGQAVGQLLEPHPVQHHLKLACWLQMDIWYASTWCLVLCMRVYCQASNQTICSDVFFVTFAFLERESGG